MKGFIFHTDKCVGCHACVVACSVENNLEPGKQWRNITPANPSGLPDLPVFFLSMACNHCEEPSCMKACPAAAFSIDTVTGAVVLDQDRCIGCKYCTWACPYDAPKYNPLNGTVQKCSFCAEGSLKLGYLPACARNCPVGALEFGEMGETEATVVYPLMPDSANKPKIRFVEGRKRSVPEIFPDTISAGTLRDAKKHIPEPDGKISPKTEWSLYLFSLLVPVFIGLFSGILMDLVFIKPWIYITLILSVMLISIQHLGRKFRAVYAIRNLKTSWLSREVFSFVLFGILTSVFLAAPTANVWLSMVGFITGFFCLYSIDRVYRYFNIGKGKNIHSSQAFLSGLLWISVVWQDERPLLFIIALKALMYFLRWIRIWSSQPLQNKILAFTRVALLIIGPLYIFLFTEWSILYSFIPLFFGEVIDRAEFYSQQTLPSPGQKANEFIQNGLQKMGAG